MGQGAPLQIKKEDEEESSKEEKLKEKVNQPQHQKKRNWSPF